MCLEYISCSGGDTEKMKEHITTIHCAKYHVEKLAGMCGEAEEREEREGWSLDDIIEEEKERREEVEKRRAESGGLMGMLRGKFGKTDYTDSDAASKKKSIIMCRTNTFKNRKAHINICGLSEIRECGEEGVSSNLFQLEPSIVSF